MRPIKNTPNNNSYLAAALFFLMMLTVCVVFSVIMALGNTEGTLGDTGNGTGVFGSGAGDGTGGAEGDGIGEEKGPDALTAPGSDQPTEQPTEQPSGNEGESSEQKNENPAPADEKKESETETEVDDSKQKNFVPQGPVAQLYSGDVEKNDDDDKTDEDVTGDPNASVTFSSGGKSVFKVKKHDNVLFIIDISSSMSTETAEKISRLEVLKLQLLATIRSQMRAGSRGKYGIITFESSHKYFPDDKKDKQLRFISSKDFEKVEAWLKNVYSGGGTNLYPALESAIEMIKKREIKVDTIFLLTDGEPSCGYRQDYISLLKKDLPKKVIIHTISIGTSSQLLKDIAKECRGQYNEFR